jgi:class 3 adenylate cyclase
MLFSDIEGSTALLSRLDDRYGQVLSDHRAPLRAAIAAWHGREMGTEGDSFFVVFSSAGDVVTCAMAAQRALTRHDWPGGDAVRVRMGLHSGQPVAFASSHAIASRATPSRARSSSSAFPLDCFACASFPASWARRAVSR